jgi:hypothetical protein
MHRMEFTTIELAGILACVLPVLIEPPDNEMDILKDSLQSVVQKINAEFNLPVTVAD